MNSNFSALPDDIQALLDAEKQSAEVLADAAQARVAEQLSVTLGIPLLTAGTAVASVGTQASATAASAAVKSAGTQASATAASAAVKSAGTQVAATAIGAKAATATGSLVFLSKTVAAGAFIVGAVFSGNTVYQDFKNEEPAQKVGLEPKKQDLELMLSQKTLVKRAKVQEVPSQKIVKIHKIYKKSVKEVSQVKENPKKALQQEQALLWQAKKQLHAGNAAKCLSLLKKHAKRFVKGQLTEEREALQVLANVRMGKTTLAQNLGKEFLQKYPHSPLRILVEKALR